VHHDKEDGDDQKNKGHHKQDYNVQCEIVLGKRYQEEAEEKTP